MLLQTRWIKIFKDIWANRTRSLLVVLSIAVGIAAVGMINSAAYMVERDLNAEFARGNPAQLEIYLSPFQKDLAKAVEGMREVQSADARRVVSAQAEGPKGEWEDIRLNVLADYGSARVNQFTPEAGAAMPRSREILLERRSAEGLGLQVGDTITIKMPGDRRFELKVAGLVHDVYIMPFTLMHEATGYVSMGTLQWLGEAPYYNRLDITVSQNGADREHVLRVGEQIKERILLRSGYRVGSIQIPGLGSEPGQHWAHKQMNGFLLILQIMGVMAILLSGGLTINTISAMLAQQTQQIGIMRAVGAVRRQLIGMYLFNVLVFSLLGLLIAYPLGWIGGIGLGQFAADIINFDLSQATLPPQVLLQQTALGLLVPLAAALAPILTGTRISVYDAIYQQGMQREREASRLEKLLVKIRSLSPPILFSLRNTFRKKARLAFTLTTLTLAGAMFISVFSTRASLNSQIRQISHYIAYDASISLPGGANKKAAEREALRISGVGVAEGWATARGKILHLDGSQSEEVEIVGLPPDSATVEPLMLAGRWLQPGDSHQVVVNEDLLEEETSLSVGSSITLKVGEKESTYEVVGIASKHVFVARIYMDYTAFGKLTGRLNQVDLVRVRASANAISDSGQQRAIADKLEERFKNAGLSNNPATTQDQFYAMFTDVFNIILVVLVIMAAVLAVVGGLGLTGTMGMNVLERTREIGVLRAVGASNGSVRRMVVLEGMTVALIAWVLGAAASGPSGWALSSAVIRAVLSSNPTYEYSYLGLLVWLGVVAAIGVVSSLAPAQKAALLTVRETLDYE